MVRIIEESREYVIVYKPAGIPSQQDPTGDPDAMSITSELLSSRGESSSLWLIHRLDRTVGGLIVFARTKTAAAELSDMVASDKMRKTYLAVAEGIAVSGEYRDFLYKDARISKAFVVDRKRAGVKEAILECEAVATCSGRTLCRIDLHTGRYHQIRAQLSSRGTPLVGDGKYGSRDKGARTPALWAYKLEFDFRRKHVCATLKPDTTLYPWCVFEREISEEVL